MRAFVYSNEKLAAYAIFILRLTLGVIMFAHGAQKVLGVFGGKGLPDSAVGMNQYMGIPLPLAYLASFTEFLGGLALIFGLLTRFFSAALFINMMVAVVVGHLANGFFAPTGFEYPFSLAL